jgi:type IV secretory pathway TraG/TraD family ATPase VirD4
MGIFEQLSLFSHTNKGLLLNGRELRLSERVSFEHLAVIARTGAGKTSNYIIPNMFTLDNCSMVVTDLSGELFEKTSGYLWRRKGFDIQAINFSSVEDSFRYNPLAHIRGSEDVAELSHILIKSANPKATASEKYWLDGAEQLLTILINGIRDSGREELMNLASLKRLLNSFGDELDTFMAENSSERTFEEYKGLLKGNDRVIDTFVSTANNSLRALGNENIVELTNSNSIDFQKLRERKTVFYLIVPQEKLEFYSFLINIFYTQLFHFTMSSRDSKQLPIYMLLDEFGHLAIPNFSTLITTIRKYRVSISIIIQSITQLKERYGVNEANTILNGGVGSKIFFNGGDLDTVSMLEKMLGEVDRDYQDESGITHKRKEKVMSLDKIRTMDDSEAIFLYANKRPLILNMKPYFKSWKFKMWSKIKPVR